MDSPESVEKMIWNAEVFLTKHRQMTETELALTILADPSYSEQLHAAEELVKFNQARQEAKRRIQNGF